MKIGQNPPTVGETPTNFLTRAIEAPGFTYMRIICDMAFWGDFAKYVSNRKSDNAILFRSIELVNKKPIRFAFGPKLTSLNFFEKNHMAK